MRGLLVVTSLWLLVVPAAAMAQAPTASSGPCGVSGYDRAARPHAPGVPTPVSLGVYLLDLKHIDVVRQTAAADFVLSTRWKDPRLARGAGKPCEVPLDRIWHPRTLILNAHGLRKELDLVVIDEQGQVGHDQRFEGDLAIRLRLHDFPFDRQRLAVSVLSLHEPTAVTLHANPGSTGRAPDVSILDWTLGLPTMRARSFLFAPEARTHALLTYEIVVTRRWGFYVWKVILPLALLVVMSWAVFWLDPPNLGIQTGVAATVVLTLMVYMHRLADLLPPVSYLTRADAFIFGALLLAFLAFVEALLTGVLARSGRETLSMRIDRWARVAFPTVFVLILVRFLTSESP